MAPPPPPPPLPPPSKPKSITLRPAKFTELYTCAQVLGRAFFDDVLFGRLIHPLRDQYPDDVALFFYRLMQSDYFDWGMVFLVAAADDGTIAGVAWWHRLGEGAGRDGWALGPWDPRKLLLPLGRLWSSLSSTIHPNRAISPVDGDILVRADPFTEHVWLGPRLERWYLHFLGVHPDFQNQGIGRRLVRWGIEQAERERVGASVIAGDGKDRFYQRCGFVECLGRAGMGEGNPLADVPGGNIWWVKSGGGMDQQDRAVVREDGDGDGDGDIVKS